MVRGASDDELLPTSYRVPHLDPALEELHVAGVVERVSDGEHRARAVHGQRVAEGVVEVAVVGAATTKNGVSTTIRIGLGLELGLGFATPNPIHYPRQARHPYG